MKLRHLRLTLCLAPLFAAGVFAADDLDDIPGDPSAVPNTPPPGTPPAAIPNEPVTPTNTTSLPSNLTTPDTSRELPDDVKALEAKARASGLLTSEEDPGTALPPEEQLSRVPLRPPMSDRSWRKWAGPALEKAYNIRRGDSLWHVSEILFGNPYLWPKVWQLNANLANPHVVFPGHELQFLPGNPNSAPELAFKAIPGVTTDNLPILLVNQSMSLLDRIEETLKRQQASSQPPFRSFVLDNRPKIAGRMKLEKNSDRFFFLEGGTYPATADDGAYAVVRIEKMSIGIRSAYRLRWVGNASVTGERATITRAFDEIEPSDVLVADNFALPPFSVHEEADDKALDLLGIQEGAEVISSQYQLLGARFKASAGEPSEGALVKVKEGPAKGATLLLLRRDGRYGTFWVVDHAKEIEVR